MLAGARPAAGEGPDDHHRGAPAPDAARPGPGPGPQRRGARRRHHGRRAARAGHARQHRAGGSAQRAVHRRQRAHRGGGRPDLAGATAGGPASPSATPWARWAASEWWSRRCWTARCCCSSRCSSTARAAPPTSRRGTPVPTSPTRTTAPARSPPCWWRPRSAGCVGPLLAAPTGDLAHHVGVPHLAGPFLLAGAAYAAAAAFLATKLRPDPLMHARELAASEAAATAAAPGPVPAAGPAVVSHGLVVGVAGHGPHPDRDGRDHDDDAGAHARPRPRHRRRRLGDRPARRRDVPALAAHRVAWSTGSAGPGWRPRPE